MPRLVKVPAIWRNRNYMILWSGQLISVTGSGASGIAVPLLVLGITHSAADAGLVTALFGLPYPLVGLTAGGLVDRWDRRLVMMVCEAANVLVTSSVPVAIWLHVLSLAQLCVVAFVSGTFFVFFNVAEFAALPSVVPAEQFPQGATAQNQATQAVSALVGPPLGGALFQISRALPFAADVASYFVSFMSFFFIRADFTVRRSTRGNLMEDITEGLRWLWRDQIIRTLTLLTTGTNLLGGGFGILLIVLARQHHATPTVIGAIFAIGALGGIVGAVLGSWVQKNMSLRTTGLLFFWANALLFPLYAVVPNVIAIGLVSSAIFFMGPIYNVVFQSYRLSLIPNELLGRVNGSARVVAWGAVPIGAVLTGVLLQTIGSSGTIWAMVAVYLLLAIAVTYSSVLEGVSRPGR